jgi:hypothetical protein
MLFHLLPRRRVEEADLPGYNAQYRTNQQINPGGGHE